MENMELLIRVVYIRYVGGQREMIEDAELEHHGKDEEEDMSISAGLKCQVKKNIRALMSESQQSGVHGMLIGPKSDMDTSQSLLYIFIFKL